MTEKSSAMSESNPMGMNSEVLNMKAAHVRPINDIHCFNVMLSLNISFVFIS